MAAATAVVVTLLLGVKQELHTLVGRIERKELLATLRLLLIAIVLLPVLPDQGYGPWQALNPYRIWWMVVLIAAISYVGYFAIKIVGGKRGILLTGLLGGMVSSTAVAVNFAKLARDKRAAGDLVAAGIVLAAATMFPRVLIVASVIAPPLLAQLVWPLLAATAIAVAGAVALGARIQSSPATDDRGAEPRNPLDLKFAVQFGLLLAAVMVLTRGFAEWLGDVGLYIIAVLSGVGDVDAITLSLAAMVDRGEAAAALAAAAVLAAAATNTAVKPALAAAIGGWRLGLRAALPLAVAVAAGGLTLWLTPAAAG